MSEEQKVTSVEPPWKSWVDSVSKLGAASVLVLYATGYLIVSVNLSSSGMSLTNPFKPKIVAAGLLFALLFGLPVWAFFETIRQAENPIQGLKGNAWFDNLYKFIRFFQVCVFLALPLNVIFVVDQRASRWKLWAVLAVIVVETTFVTTARNHVKLDRWLSTHSTLASSVYGFLLMFLILIGATSMGRGGFNWLLIPFWLFAAGVYVKSLGIPVSNNIGGTWPTALVQSFLPILIFATGIYPHVKSEWGGGQPVDVVVVFTKDSPLFPLQKVKMRLLDENDSGIYVTQIGHKHALFIPRADVGALAYSGDPNDLP